MLALRQLYFCSFRSSTFYSFSILRCCLLRLYCKFLTLKKGDASPVSKAHCMQCRETRKVFFFSFFFNMFLFKFYIYIHKVNHILGNKHVCYLNISGSLTWHASKHKVHKFYMRMCLWRSLPILYLLKCQVSYCR